ncbi:hypothetical protein AURDEDRAFT_187913 [Auricularia subglabra TFB-10046 SS5]|uniref:F-box domain-containing protein n=1 Tax=Auricularia subglabra (strain TFB-10046 / SS5) TaxID=717982 RepID=J0DBD4_AURST|nr:hypothetical protein AURDEDRAFT_187913 [Auricularia subglabra TFB-10046 SS5]
MHSWIDQAIMELAPRANTGCPVFALPREVLGMIFALVADPDDFFTEALLDLGDVCSHWNAVVRGTPSLWTTVKGAAASPDEKIAPHLAWRLARTQGAPVDLTLSLPDDMECDALSEALLPHMHHVRTLELDAGTRLLSGRHPAVAALLTRPARALVRLAIHETAITRAYFTIPGPAAFPPDLFSNDAPALQDLFLNRLCPPPVNWPPLRALRRFEYCSFDIDALRLAAVIRGLPATTCALRARPRHVPSASGMDPATALFVR